jgi:hypothetical protein
MEIDALLFKSSLLLFCVGVDGDGGGGLWRWRLRWRSNRAPPLGHGWWSGASPCLLPSLYRWWRSVSRIDKSWGRICPLGLHICCYVWRNRPTEPGTAVRYGAGLPVLMVAKATGCFRILDAISSYELRFGCSSARWTRMDEGYNTFALDLKYNMLENITFPHLIWLSMVRVTLPHCALLVPFAPFFHDRQ